MQKFRLSGFSAFMMSVVIILVSVVPAISQPKVAQADFENGYYCEDGGWAWFVEPGAGALRTWRMNCYNFDYGYWFIRECSEYDWGEPGLPARFCENHYDWVS